MSGALDRMQAQPVAAGPALETYFRQVDSFAATRERSTRRSARIAWSVATAAVLYAGAATLGVAVLAMRPMPDPIVLRVNDTTGAVDRVYDVQGGEMAANEAEQRYWLWRFVQAAESYSWAEARQNFETVTLMSTPEVQNRYAERVNASNKQSPQIVLGRSGQATLSWIGTTFVSPGVAQVRYTVTARKGDNVLPKRSMVATVTFDFAKGAMRGSAINVNPRGFIVTNYHVDEEAPQ